MSSKPEVAVIGLGTMGHPFAANLLKAGFNVHVWNRSPGKDEDLVAAGAKSGESAADAARHADVVISMLSTPEVTEQVLFDEGVLAALGKESVLAQMGTIGIEATLKLAKRSQDEFPDVIWIDAPVSGSKKPAEDATLLVLASGDEKRASHKVQPVFDAIGKGTRWLGDIGAGSRMKLVVNAWLVMLMQGTTETALLAQELGFTTDDLWSVLDGGPLAAPYMKPKLAKIANNDFSTEMALEWGLKDALLALDAGKKETLPTLNEVANVWKEASDSGLAKKDISSVSEFLGKR